MSRITQCSELRSRPRWVAGLWPALVLGLLSGSVRAVSSPAPVQRGLAGEAPSAPSSSREFKLGVLFWHPSPSDFAALEGVKRGLADADIAHSLVIEEAEEDEDRARRILAAFREQSFDLVFALGTRASLLAAEELDEIPVVFTAVTSPVESGVVSSWEGSGTNVAGNSNWIQPQLLVEVFQLAVPGLERLGILRSAGSGMVSAAELRAMRRHLESADAPRLDIVEAVADGPEGLPGAVGALIAERVQALWIPIDLHVYSHLDIVETAVGPRTLPLVSSSPKGALAGAVAGVLVDYPMLGRRAADLARRILEDGADPGALPIETMQGYRVVVNLGAARRCGYELPLSLLVLADQILDDASGAPGR